MPTKAERQIQDAMATNVGENVLAIVESKTSSLVIGKLILSMVDAAVKAALPGRQSSKNAKLYAQAGKKAFARKLARKAKQI